ncbi:MAG: hypothetical protein RLO08_14320 [Parvibaculaceae bacterium]
MAKDPETERLRRARDAEALRLKDQREQQKAKEALEFLEKKVDIDKYEATKWEAESKAERRTTPLAPQNSLADRLAKKGQRRRGFRRRGDQERER